MAPSNYLSPYNKRLQFESLIQTASWDHDILKITLMTVPGTMIMIILSLVHHHIMSCMQETLNWAGHAHILL